MLSRPDLQNLETTPNFSNLSSKKHPLSQSLDLFNTIPILQIELFHSIARLVSLSFFLYYMNIMAQVCTSKPIIAIFVALVLSVSARVSAQGGAMAPSPSMDTGAAFSLPVSAVAVAFSLIVSFLALLKH
ncbi:hypothetical protein V6N13_009313 [Hibiscus sabdariffa]|uniref:Uncharacterized protein n=2 Tax=Hibiscus sabdariffa TaxID=183260 RepID=A0ABR1Z993_9ROSI